MNMNTSMRARAGAIMNLAIVAALALGMTGAARALAVEYRTVDMGRSSIGFVFREMGVAIDGHFSRYAVQIRFDPARPASAQAAIDLDLGSIDAGSDEANDEVGGKSWFNTRTFPQAHFESSSVHTLGANRYELTGTLTIKGRTHEVVVPFTLTPQGAAAAFDGKFILKRADFGIGEGEWAAFDTVANEIEVKFHILAAAGK
jgi:polyisoprenoid-binding protein YceI